MYMYVYTCIYTLKGFIDYYKQRSTNIFVTFRDGTWNMELSNVSQWLAANKLSLNVAKTKFIVFHMHQKAVTYPDLYLNGNKIERVTQFNYLGLILQANSSMNKHISHISLKVSKTIGILNRLKSIYPRKVLLTLYNTLILPHFNLAYFHGDRF